jgi:hypothetical protein
MHFRTYEKWYYKVRKSAHFCAPKDRGGSQARVRRNGAGSEAQQASHVALECFARKVDSLRMRACPTQCANFPRTLACSEATPSWLKSGRPNDRRSAALVHLLSLWATQSFREQSEPPLRLSDDDLSKVPTEFRAPAGAHMSTSAAATHSRFPFLSGHSFLGAPSLVASLAGTTLRG